MRRGYPLFLRMLLWMLLGSLAWPVHAQSDDAVERARIAQERSVADQRLREQEQACATRFAVSACVEAARKTHRETMAPLRQQEFLLDDQRRQQRAAERRLELERKAAQPESDLVLPGTHPGALDDAASQSKQSKQSSAAPRTATSAQDSTLAEQQRVQKQTAAQTQAAKRAQAQREKVELAKQRKAAVEKRNAEKAASGKPPAAALPVPEANR
ncbi:MAG: hypothetical protein ACKOF9_15330 [Burkholderiales bacterium]